MNPILTHPLFANMVCEHAKKSLKKSKLTCNFCSFTGSDYENFNEDGVTCNGCQDYLEAMRIYGMSLEEVSQRFGLLGSIRAMEHAVGTCTPPTSILAAFKVFFNKLRAIPEIRKAISEGLDNERKRKDRGS